MLTGRPSAYMLAVQPNEGNPMNDHPAQDWLDTEADHTNDLDDHKAQRDDFATRLKATGEGLAKAGKEMADLKQAMDDVDRRMEALDQKMMSPAMARRATLNQVWDRLVDAGNISGAMMVMKMISDTRDDWTQGGGV